jgi:hypothetical protein
MSRFCCSLVTCGLALTLAGSFEAARANDKNPNQQPAGGKPAAGVPFPGMGSPAGSTLPGTRRGQPAASNNSQIQGGSTVGGHGTQGNIGGGAPVHYDPMQGRGSQGNIGTTQSVTTGATSKTPDHAGTQTSIFDRWGNLRSSTKQPKTRVEPGAGKQSLSGNGGGLPFHPNGTVKVNPLSGQPRLGSQETLTLHGHPKTKPLAVSKNGGLTLDLPKGTAISEHTVANGLTAKTSDVSKGERLETGDKIGKAIDTGKQTEPQNDKLHSLLQAKNRDDLNRELKRFKIAENESPRPQDRVYLKYLNLDKMSGFHQERLAKLDNFQHWQPSNVGQKLHFKQQFELQRQGDLSRRLNLSTNLLSAGGWAKHRQYGVIAAGFTTSAFGVWYAGGGCYPAHTWCPIWSPWVDWCWWDTCPALYDPRPYSCIPIFYGPCAPWVFYGYPVWQTLPVVSCGTWIDVSPVVMAGGLDLQLLAVRFVDNGHPEQRLGPRYRVWVRNNSPVQIATPFSVLLLASNEQTPTVELPQMGVVVPSMDIGETKALDIRLSLAANRLGVTPAGDRVPFTYLHVLVDAHQQIPETFEDNNGAVLVRKDILPVDPAAFSADLTAAAPESLLTIAGEGFGPEPGQVFVSVYGQQVQAEIHGWYDLGIQFAVPNFELTQPVDAEFLVVRGDSAISNPLTVRLAPHELLEDAAVIPESPIPDAPQ